MEFAESLHGHPKLPEWLSTHPSHGNRAEHLDKAHTSGGLTLRKAEAFIVMVSFIFNTVTSCA